MTTAATALAAIATVEVTAMLYLCTGTALLNGTPADAVADACAKEDGADNEMIKDIVAKIFKIRIS